MDAGIWLDGLHWIEQITFYCIKADEGSKGYWISWRMPMTKVLG